MIGVEVTIARGEDAVDKIGIQLPKELEKLSEKELKEVGKFLQFIMKANAPVYSGLLRDSIRVKVIDKTRINVVSDVPWAGYMEFGYKGHAAPMTDRLAGWVLSRRGFGAYKRAMIRGWYYVTGRPHRFIRPAVEELKSVLPEMLAGDTYAALAKVFK